MFKKNFFLSLALVVVFSGITYAGVDSTAVSVDSDTNKLHPVEIPATVKEEADKSMNLVIENNSPSKNTKQVVGIDIEQPEVTLKGDVNIIITGDPKPQKKVKIKETSEYDKKFANLNLENIILIRKQPYYNLLSSFNPNDIILDPETNLIAKNTDFNPSYIIAVTKHEISSDQQAEVTKQQSTKIKNISFQGKTGLKSAKFIANSEPPSIKTVNQTQEQKFDWRDNPVFNFFKKSYNFVKRKFQGLFKKLHRE